MTVERRFDHPSLGGAGEHQLSGRRVTLRPLVTGDFEQFADVRQRNHDWLTPWEPRRPDVHHDPSRIRDAFSARCAHRERERRAGAAYGFGLFVDHRFAGEVNLNNVIRGAFQNATVGYWIDRSHAGQRYVPEGVVVVARFAFEQLRLHRLEICIVPRNDRSRRVMEILAIREEGLAERYLEIDGTWEDHVRYAITAEEWEARRTELAAVWLDE
jgi:[ribosomal protein S5]-alanine N-acetyltransferase